MQVEQALFGEPNVDRRELGASVGGRYQDMADLAANDRPVTRFASCAVSASTLVVEVQFDPASAIRRLSTSSMIGSFDSMI